MGSNRPGRRRLASAPALNRRRIRDARARTCPATVYRENRQIHIPDLDNIDPSMANWPATAARAAGIRTICGTPLRRGGKAIGALIVYRDRLAPFTDEELALQQSFADQAVIAIENARLFNETQEALERQTATADILQGDRELAVRRAAGVRGDRRAARSGCSAALSSRVFRVVIDDTVHFGGSSRRGDPRLPSADAASSGSVDRIAAWSCCRDAGDESVARSRH